MLLAIWQGNSGALRSALSAVSLNLVLFAAVLYVPYSFLRVLRWKQLLAIQKIEYSLASSFRLYYATAFLGMLTPGRVGELSRLVYLHRDHGTPHSMSLAGTVVDRLHDLCMLLFLSSALFAVPKLRLIESGIWAVALVAGALLLSPHVTSHVLSVVLRRQELRDRAREALSRYRGNLSVFMTKSHYLPAVTTAMGAVIYGIIIALLQRAVGVELPIAVAAGIGALGTLASILPISVLGIGTRDAALAASYIALGVSNPGASAIAYSALYLIFFSGISSAVGFVAYQIDPLHSYYLRPGGDKK